MQDIVVVVMAGGAGTRFWPVSTEDRSKQFLSLLGERTLLQSTLDRVESVCPADRRLVLTGAAQVEQVRAQLPELPAQAVVGEPARRDTAAALALAALLCRKLYGDPVMLVLPADHWIRPVEAFQRALTSAARAARESGRLYTFAVPPTWAETGYGYLELGRSLTSADGVRHHELVSFREKPDRATAEHFLKDGRFYWNSGMFCWTVSAILSEFELHLPEHLERLAPALAAHATPAWEERLSEAFSSLRSISIDYAVMEKAQRRAAVVAEFDWSDVGGWMALRPFLPTDASDNAARARLAVLDSRGNLVFSEDENELVALVGAEDLVVVRAGARTLVAHRSRLEEVKRLVASLPNPADR